MISSKADEFGFLVANGTRRVRHLHAGGVPTERVPVAAVAVFLSLATCRFIFFYTGSEGAAQTK